MYFSCKSSFQSKVYVLDSKASLRSLYPQLCSCQAVEFVSNSRMGAETLSLTLCTNCYSKCNLSERGRRH